MSLKVNECIEIRIRIYNYNSERKVDLLKEVTRKKKERKFCTNYFYIDEFIDVYMNVKEYDILYLEITGKYQKNREFHLIRE